MKEISKVKVYLKKSICSTLLEKQILSYLHYPFLANLNFSFQDKEYLYLVLDYLPGGDLRYYINKGIIFSEIQIKFFISNIILSLNYIHSMNIIHRDIKPENLVFDGRGYLHLTDFGIARKIKSGKPIIDKSGTPGYLSPETLLKKPQNFSSDFFSIGVICYELLFGKKPFRGKNKKEVAEKILYKNINIKQEHLPENFSPYLPDFINRLLKRNQVERLGYKSIEEIKNHKWLRGLEWDVIENKMVECENIPFTPMIGDNFDNDFVNKRDNINLDHYNEYLKKINESEIFKNFYFNYYTFNLSLNKKGNYSTGNSGNKTATRTMSDGLNVNDETLLENNNDDIILMKKETKDLELKKQLSNKF